MTQALFLFHSPRISKHWDYRRVVVTSRAESAMRSHLAMTAKCAEPRRPNLPGRFTGVRGELRYAEVCNVAVRTDQDPSSLECDDLGRMTAAQMIEEPAAVVKPSIRHSIPGCRLPIVTPEERELVR